MTDISDTDISAQVRSWFHDAWDPDLSLRGVA